MPNKGKKCPYRDMDKIQLLAIYDDIASNLDLVYITYISLNVLVSNPKILAEG